MHKVLEAVQALPRDYPGLNALDPFIVYLMACMKFDQFCCTWRSLENPERFCPFCPTELARRGRKPIRHSDKWALFSNEFPRGDVEHMLLIIPKRHVVNPGNLNPKDYLDMGFLFQGGMDEFNMPGGALVLRFGDPRDHAGTIEHLHFNLIQPTREGGMSIPLAKKPGGSYGHLEDYVRLRRFVNETRDRGGVDWLFSDKGVVETQPPAMK